MCAMSTFSDDERDKSDAGLNIKAAGSSTNMASADREDANGIASTSQKVKSAVYKEKKKLNILKMVK